MLVYIKPLSMFPKLHSDTLFGAILSAVSEIFPSKVDEIIKDFENNNPPFLLSSTFPNIDSKRFYPKIIQENKDHSIKDKNALKEYKKIEYVEEEIFLDLIRNNLTESDILNNFDDYTVMNNLLLKNELDENIEISSTIIPHNSVNRLTKETEIFYSEGEEFNNIGLFFIISINNPEYENIIKSSLKFLKDRGFGKNISTGQGQFDYEISDEDLNFKESGDKFITLSRFIPSSNDIANIDINSSYEIGSKRGRSKSGEIRKQVRFFKEGSTFPNYGESYGTIVKSGEITPAIEYGYAFPVFIGGK
ncbi:type III-A CRISPR-associated RAMP protein Csm4 [uncultured Methanobrevibacter sp.]|uniref:type III-A CRISPR-associated RAMP protein Csm4 n=1 Tax=uncultured Methanobrevibacter sp. TaxID=253161 RepID=UPI0026DF02C3|nr:type III-A CRISPR-associated RAMP protein Csm4 [uncultured Methanobrevibacter sp.]